MNIHDIVTQLCVIFTLHPWQWYAVVAYFFLCWASFSGVMADRLPAQVGLKMDGPHPVSVEPDLGVNLFSLSRCDSCGHRISALALIPVLGWLVHRGRCGHCHARVPVVYPVVEAVSAIAAVLIAAHLGPTWKGLMTLMLLAFCIPISWIDVRFHWIPDRLGLGLLYAGLLFSPFASLHDRVVGSAVMAGFLATFFWLQKLRRGLDTMAMGDVILFGAAGAWLGISEAPVIMLLTSLVYGAYALPMYLLGRRTGGVDVQDEEEDAPAWFAVGPAIVFGMLIASLLPFPFTAMLGS